jgi:hypothetical protein
MRWIKIKHLFKPDSHAEWMLSHAANPWAETAEHGAVKIYFTCRDAQNRSHIGWALFDFRDGFRLLRVSENPVVTPGAPGLYDDSGAAMGCLVNDEGRRLLYYLGWNLKVTVPWQNSIGLAIDSGNGFIKYSRAPLLDRSNEDPYSISYPCVLKENGVWKMWYGSNLSWGKKQEEMKHVIKYAESADGINWNRNGKVVVGFAYPEEYALSKPMVVKTESGYHMWFSFRAGPAGDKYRIGYAHSSDGDSWLRNDSRAGIDVSESGWDSESIEYPCVFRFDNDYYMLYNGNDYGREGFGIARLEGGIL